jgi:hypothetical protein
VSLCSIPTAGEVECVRERFSGQVQLPTPRQTKEESSSVRRSQRKDSICAFLTGEVELATGTLG